MDVGYFGQDRTERMLREKVQRQWMDAYAPVRHLDPVLVLTAIVLAAIGVVAIYSASFQRLEAQGLDPMLYATKQAIAFGIGLGAMAVAAVVDYRYIRVYSPLIYVVTLVMLALVLSPIGVTVNGARRWLVLGGFQLQPSEVAKLAVLLALAALLHERKSEPGPATVFWSLVLVGPPMVLIFLEPDLGTMIVFVWVTFVLLLVSGLKARYLIGLSLAGLGGVVAAFQLDLIKAYQLARLTSFLDADNVDLAQTSAYHQGQSLIAIGSGQITGQGLFQGRQTNLSYVPENHSDFIFTVIAEELGFFGGLLVLALFGVLIWRGLRIAAMAKDSFGTLVAAGTVGLLALQVFVNIGMTMGIMPVTGIPLPFLSAGGTSLILWFTLTGLLLNIHMRRF